MKTQVWTPPPAGTVDDTAFTVDDEAVFVSTEAKVNKRCTLLGALMAGASYSTLGMSFEIRKSDQTVLAQFVPGSEVQGFPALKQALLEIAVHVDFNVRQAVVRTSQGIKAEIAPLMQQLVDKGVAEALAARGIALDAESSQEAGGEAPADPPAAPPAEASTAALAEAPAPGSVAGPNSPEPPAQTPQF